jgi:hypothetical protein
MGRICRRLVTFFPEDLNLLWAAVVEHYKIGRCQVRNRLALLVRGNDADLDQSRCGAKYPCRRLRGRLLPRLCPL